MLIADMSSYHVGKEMILEDKKKTRNQSTDSNEDYQEISFLFILHSQVLDKISCNTIT